MELRAQEEEKRGNSSHDGPERGILDIGCLFFPSSKAPMSWLRMSKLFLLFSLQSLCCPA